MEVAVDLSTWATQARLRITIMVKILFIVMREHRIMAAFRQNSFVTVGNNLVNVDILTLASILMGNLITEEVGTSKGSNTVVLATIGSTTVNVGMETVANLFIAAIVVGIIILALTVAVMVVMVVVVVLVVSVVENVMNFVILVIANSEIIVVFLIEIQLVVSTVVAAVVDGTTTQVMHVHMNERDER